MKWTKLEYGKWPEGDIVMRIKDGNDFIHYQIGEIAVFVEWGSDTEVYFIENQNNEYTKVTIDSIYDTEPHYILLNEITMPEAKE